jgi:hypothetical protein
MSRRVSKGGERVQYLRVRDGRCAYVIVDFASDGREIFAEQESGEVRWWDFSPTAEEQEFAHRLLRDGKGKGWRDMLVLPTVLSRGQG